jgi:hypothetical protein
LGALSTGWDVCPKGGAGACRARWLSPSRRRPSRCLLGLGQPVSLPPLVFLRPGQPVGLPPLVFLRPGRPVSVHRLHLHYPIQALHRVGAGHPVRTAFPLRCPARSADAPAAAPTPLLASSFRLPMAPLPAAPLGSGRAGRPAPAVPPAPGPAGQPASADLPAPRPADRPASADLPAPGLADRPASADLPPPRSEPAWCHALG